MNIDLNFKGIAKIVLLIFAILQTILYLIALITQPATLGSLLMSSFSLLAAIFTAVFVFFFVFIEYKLPNFFETVEIQFWLMIALLVSGTLFNIFRFAALILVEYFALNPIEECYVTGGTLGAFGRINALWILMGLILIWQSKLPQKQLAKVWNQNYINGNKPVPQVPNQRDQLLQ